MDVEIIQGARRTVHVGGEIDFYDFDKFRAVPMDAARESPSSVAEGLEI